MATVRVLKEAVSSGKP